MSSTTINSGNWSGYQVNTQSPNYAQAFWTVPRVFVGGNKSGYSSIWPGIGGGFNGGSGKLIQAGTEQDAICVTGSCSAFQTEYYFWLEIYPDEPEQEVTNLIPAPGDAVAADVYWSSAGGADFTLCDWDQNTCVTGTQASGAPSATAEWIVERPTVNGVLPNLADFGLVTMSNGYFDETPQGSAEYTIRQGNPKLINMYSGSTLLASTGALDSTGTSFTVTYHNHG